MEKQKYEVTMGVGENMAKKSIDNEKNHIILINAQFKTQDTVYTVHVIYNMIYIMIFR